MWSRFSAAISAVMARASSIWKTPGKPRSEISRWIWTWPGLFSNKTGSMSKPEEPGTTRSRSSFPLIKNSFPDSRLVALRAPHSQAAVGLGRVLVELARDQGKTLKVFGSTDLTHYGPNYGFSPQGHGPQALEWMKTVNDKGFIDLALAMDTSGLLQHAARNHSACSAGAVAAAITACQALGSKQGRLVDYYTSHDLMPNDSFVGYAGIVY